MKMKIGMKAALVLMVILNTLGAIAEEGGIERGNGIPPIIDPKSKIKELLQGHPFSYQQQQQQQQ